MIVSNSIKLLGLGSLLCAGATALAGDGPERASSRTNMPVSPLAHTLPVTDSPSSEGGPTGDCVYDNFRKLDDFGTPASQKDPFYPFYAEAADDFVLSGDPDNGCVLDDIWTSVTFFNTPGGLPVSPIDCWDGIKITIYEDITAGVPDPNDPNCQGLDKGPAGYPDNGALPDRAHRACFAGAVVCELKVSMTQVEVFPQDTVIQPPGFAWDVHIFGLADVFDCKLDKQHKYWIAIAPVQEFFVCGQTSISLSQNNLGHPAMQIFELLGIAPWLPIPGNAGANPNFPPGTLTDLAIRIQGVKQEPPPPNNCPWDLNGDGQINAADLAVLLGKWGPYGPPCPPFEPSDFNQDCAINAADLAKLLGAWGDCPPDVDLFLDQAAFFAAVAATGKEQKLFWDFKPHVLPPGAAVPVPDPLDINTHFNNPLDPWRDAAGNNLWPPEVDNIQFRANRNPQGPFDPCSVGGASCLIFGTAGAAPDINNNFLFEGIGPDNAFDIISGPPAGDNHTAIAIELLASAGAEGPFGFPATFHISIYDKQDVEIGKFIITALTGEKIFVGFLTKVQKITIGRIDIFTEEGWFDGISAIWAFNKPEDNPFGCPGTNECCQASPDGTPGCNNTDCCRRVCEIDPFCCDQVWDTLCAQRAAKFPQCGCDDPGIPHDLQPCLPDDCPPDQVPEWCLYLVQEVNDPAICQQRGIFPGAIICVATCPFPGDPAPCQPNAPDPKVNFRVIDNGCVFNALSLDRCEPCPAGSPKFLRLN